MSEHNLYCRCEGCLILRDERDEFANTSFDSEFQSELEEYGDYEEDKSKNNSVNLFSSFAFIDWDTDKSFFDNNEVDYCDNNNYYDDGGGWD